MPTQIALETFKQLWLENKLAIMNRKNKATFEAFVLLNGEEPPYYFYSDEKEEDIEISSWQSLKKLKDTEFFYNDGAVFLKDDGIFIEPEIILNSFKNV